MPVVAGTINAMPFADASFSVVVSLDVLSHAAVDPKQALAEMLRVLQPGGMLIVNLPAFEWLRSAHDTRVQNARRFTTRSAAALLTEAGMQRVRPHYWNSLLLPMMMLRRKVVARVA